MCQCCEPALTPILSIHHHTLARGTRNRRHCIKGSEAPGPGHTPGKGRGGPGYPMSGLNIGMGLLPAHTDGSHKATTEEMAQYLQITPKPVLFVFVILFIKNAQSGNWKVLVFFPL